MPTNVPVFLFRWPVTAGPDTGASLVLVVGMTTGVMPGWTDTVTVWDVLLTPLLAVTVKVSVVAVVAASRCAVVGV